MGKNARALSIEKSNELTDQQDMFCFHHTSVFYMSNNIKKNFDL